MSSYPHFDPEERTAYYEESYERDLDALDVLEQLADEAEPNIELCRQGSNS